MPVIYNDLTHCMPVSQKVVAVRVPGVVQYMSMLASRKKGVVPASTCKRDLMMQ